MEAILFLGGLFVGIGLSMLFRKKQKPSGSFVIDFRDPLKDVCTLELEEDLNSIYSKELITLRIKTYGDISQD